MRAVSDQDVPHRTHPAPRAPDGDAVAEMLREQGYRHTRPRQVVWDVVRRAEAHLTAEEIAERAGRLAPGVNLASVYRSLALLADLELVRETRLGERDAARWELAHADEHFHLVCDDCGGVTHHAGDLVEQVRTHLAEEHGFEVDSVELVVSGRCAACAGR
jgi:Fur family transcriptional regulator, ferric uptake regulator